jgi:hypothetical protein
VTLSWTLNRLRAMSWAEIVHRMGEVGKRRVSEKRHEGWSRFDRSGLLVPPPGLQCFLRGRAAGNREQVLRAAERVACEPFAALGRSWPRIDFKQPIGHGYWAMDPVTGGHWPHDVYCFKIPYRHRRDLGDIKYVWELNRLQFLQPLAAAVQLAPHECAGYVALIDNLIASWFHSNPPFRGVAWNSGIEVSLRAISLVIVLCMAQEHLSAETTAKISTLLRASIFWLRRFPSKYSSANNHLIAEAAGIHLASRCIPELMDSESARWALDTLSREACLQFHSDGVPGEQSPTYGAFSAEFLHLCMQSSGASEFPAPSVDRLRKFASFVHSLPAVSGEIPTIGDADEGHVVEFGFEPGTYASQLANSIAPSPERKSITFEEGGYTIVHEGRWSIAFDHGPLGYLAIAAHGHADCLSLTALLDGQPLFVDPGTYLYHAGREWRDWFRGTRAHNTVTIDGANQSVISGPFNWSTKARAQLERVKLGPAWVAQASHDGYEGRYGVRHRRKIAADGEGLLIEDTLQGTKGRELEVEIAFQLHESCTTRVEGARCHVLRNGSAIAEITFPSDGTVRSTTGQPSGRPEDGFVSPRFGLKTPAPRVSWLSSATTGQPMVIRVQPVRS